MPTSTVAGDICVWPDAALSTPLITVPCVAAASNVAGSRQPGIDSTARPLPPAGLAEAAAGPRGSTRGEGPGSAGPKALIPDRTAWHS